MGNPYWLHQLMLYSHFTLGEKELMLQFAPSSSTDSQSITQKSESTKAARQSESIFRQTSTRMQYTISKTAKHRQRKHTFLSVK